MSKYNPSKHNISKYNPMSKEFQEEAKRLGITGNQLVSIYIKEEKIYNASRMTKDHLYMVEYFGQFVTAINPYVQWLKEEINKSKGRKIRIKIKEITKAMGEPFTIRSDNIIYNGLKFALFIEGIVVDISSNSKMLSSNSKMLSSKREEEGDVFLIMRFGNENDKLPYPFSEHLIHYLNILS